MSPTAVALLGFAAWSLVLVMSLGTYRTTFALTKNKRANTFNPAGTDLEPLGQRLTRAHANCYENLPMVAAVLLYAIATEQTAVTDPLAYAFLAARIGQSLVHVASTSNPAVLLRFALFLAQGVILAIWLLKLLGVF